MTATDHAQAALTLPLGEAIFTQRAIRRFRPDPIAEDDLAVILEAAIRAPNGGNAQPWRFLVLRDPEVRAEFATLYHEAWWSKRRDSGYETPEDLPQDPSMQAARRLADEFGHAPVVILLCATAPGAGAASSVIPAAQNLLLAARALGIGGTITTLHANVEHRVHALLDIPDGAQVVYALPLGYPRGAFGSAQRRPLGEVAAIDGWTRPFEG
jgi:nitroreductase